jgi:phytoene/squalene synthetase
MSWLSSLARGGGGASRRSLDHCISQVRQFDHEHFFCGLLLTSQPPSGRGSSAAPPTSTTSSSCCPSERDEASEAALRATYPKAPYNPDVISKTYWAIRALNIETALACEASGTARVVSEPLLAADASKIGPLARLYWWKQTVQALFQQRTAAIDRKQMDADPDFARKKEARFHGKVMRGELIPDDYEAHDPTRTPDASAAPRQHPVVDLLSQCIVDARIPLSTSPSRMWLVRHIDARIREVEVAATNQIRHIADFELLCEHAHSSLIYVALETLGFKGHPHAEHAASHVGKALGIVSILRGLPHHWSRRHLYLPLEVCQHYSLVPEKVFQHAATATPSNSRIVSLPEAQDVVYQLSCHAKEHIRHARSIIEQLPKEAVPAFLPVLIVENVLDKLLAVQFDVYHPRLANRSPLLPIKLWRAAKTAKL